VNHAGSTPAATETEPQKGIDFAWFLSVWILECHCDERVFWETMTPARLMALFEARFGKRQQAKKQEAPKMSLAQYLSGG